MLETMSYDIVSSFYPQNTVRQTQKQPTTTYNNISPTAKP